LINSLALLVATALVQPLQLVSARTERLSLGAPLALAQAPPGRPGVEAPPQAPPSGQPSQPAQTEKAAETKPEPRKPEEQPVVTRHEIRVGGRVLKYTVTTGMMPIRNDRGEDEADIFYMAYTLDRPAGAPPAARPLMFSFNGGPGSSSVWLHLGALGPRRVRMLPDGGLPPPPYELIDNEHTWLDLTDLVFVDPVGTGYSRPEKPEIGRKFWSVRGDIESVGEFIRLYLTRNERWASPLFVVGESYGTTRAAGLAGHLIDRGVAFNGVLLVSSILQFQTARFARGNDLPPVVFLPTYTATAWYHKKLAPDLQKDLRKTLDEVERWASSEYTLALAKGSALQGAERQKTIDQLARYTGLSKNYLDHTDLRIEIQRFCKELLREEGRTVGRLDSRFKGLDSLGVSERPDFDPSMAAIRPPYTAMFNHYVRNELGYKSDVPYHILGGGINVPWDWGTEGQGYADLSESLRSAFAKNRFMKVFVASGYYDLATPYYATEYTLSHMGLDPSLRDNIRVAEYEAGHMMYIHEPSLAKLKADVASFIGFALDKNGAATRSTSGGD
jgi:carboxypeptidase C (cathepsin A)